MSLDIAIYIIVKLLASYIVSILLNLFSIAIVFYHNGIAIRLSTSVAILLVFHQLAAYKHETIGIYTATVTIPVDPLECPVQKIDM